MYSLLCFLRNLGEFMKNNKGFISISVVYSFFMVFLILLLFIVNNLVSNRLLLNTIKDEIKENISDTTFSRYLINHAEEIGLTHHNSSLTNGAADNSYRFTGANPNNYVCFGSEANPCPSTNLYRIIGVIDSRIKLVHNSGITSRQIDNTDTNYYVNTAIYNYLNNDFLNTLSAYSTFIADSTWYIGGVSSTSISDNIKTIYENEVGINRNNSVRIEEKIGMIYVSDYAYATTPENYGSTITSANNWLNMSQNYWTNSRVNTTNNRFFYINTSGNLAISDVSNTYVIRPSFYLNSTVMLSSGDGTINSPYRIEV